MSYCRFENTYGDLKDCLRALEDAGSVERLIEEASEYEKPYIKKLLSLCAQITEEFEE
jgi:hypothetical protein